MKRVKFWGAILIMLIILMKPETSVQSAQRAMATWYSSVAPALFPFLALMPMLTGEEACAAYETLFSGWMRPLFDLPGSSAPAVIIGMITGSPGGALTLRRVAEHTNMTRSEMRRIAQALGGVSPAYLIMGVGQGLYGSAELGAKLAVIQASIQLLLLGFLPRGERGDWKRRSVSLIAEKQNPIASAVESLLCICGYMVFFSIIAGVLEGLVGRKAGMGLHLLLDLPSGLAAFTQMESKLKMLLQGAAIGFGGICILNQNMDVLKPLGIQWKECLYGRIVSAGLFACICAALECWPVRICQNLAESGEKTYAFSILAAGIIVIPGLYLFSKKLFLTNRLIRKK